MGIAKHICAFFWFFGIVLLFIAIIACFCSGVVIRAKVIAVPRTLSVGETLTYSEYTRLKSEADRLPPVEPRYPEPQPGDKLMYVGDKPYQLKRDGRAMVHIYEFNVTKREKTLGLILICVSLVMGAVDVVLFIYYRRWYGPQKGEVKQAAF